MQLQVVSFIQRLPGCKEQASVFREEVSGVCPDPLLRSLELWQRAQTCSAMSLQSLWHLGGSLSMELNSSMANCILLL